MLLLDLTRTLSHARSRTHAHTRIGVLFITIIARIIHTSSTMPAYCKRYYTMHIVGPGKILENLVT